MTHQLPDIENIFYTVRMNSQRLDLAFSKTVWDYYRHNQRSLPWRDKLSPYRVLVSEFMLQQTQVTRVEPKFIQWMKQWPDLDSAANASTEDILKAWQGLGYNRRALYLQAALRRIQKEFNAEVPNMAEQLISLPGIGVNTAAAIQVYAFNQPVVFIETNIRQVFIHHFFSDQTGIEDKQIVPLVEAHIDHNNPREWYWALMDYGSHLKKVVGNVTRQSQHYKRQSRFEGSHRQLRSLLLSVILEKAGLSMEMAYQVGSQWPRKQVARAIEELLSEGFIVLEAGALQSV